MMEYAPIIPAIFILVALGCALARSLTALLTGEDDQQSSDIAISLGIGLLALIATIIWSAI